MEPTQTDEWISLPDPDGRSEVAVVQTLDGQWVAQVYGSNADEAEARADRIASVPLFQAYAECCEAMDGWHEGPLSRDEAWGVLKDHGWNEDKETEWTFIVGLRRAALAKARPVPVGVMNSPEMVP